MLLHLMQTLDIGRRVLHLGQRVDVIADTDFLSIEMLVGFGTVGLCLVKLVLTVGDCCIGFVCSTLSVGLTSVVGKGLVSTTGLTSGFVSTGLTGIIRSIASVVTSTDLAD